MGKFKVLLIDDEEELVETLAERLAIRGLETKAALSGEQGLQLTEDYCPDVIVLDLRMPGIDGLEVLRRVKASHPEIQVIILTGHGSDQDRDIGRRLGSFEHLQKPVDIAVLFQALNDAYRKKLEDAELQQ